MLDNALAACLMYPVLIVMGMAYHHMSLRELRKKVNHGLAVLLAFVIRIIHVPERNMGAENH